MIDGDRRKMSGGPAPLPVQLPDASAAGVLDFAVRACSSTCRPNGSPYFHHSVELRGLTLRARRRAAEELQEIVMRRYERASSVLTSKRPVEDWGKLLGDSAAVTAMLDRLLHHGHLLKCGPRSWRTKTDLPPLEAPG